LYGLVGAEAIEEVWKQRAAARATAQNGNGSQAGRPAQAVVGS
jgi:hypothetical protein